MKIPRSSERPNLYRFPVGELTTLNVVQFINGDDVEDNQWEELPNLPPLNTERPDNHSADLDVQVLSPVSGHETVEAGLSYQRSSESYESVLGSPQIVETTSTHPFQSHPGSIDTALISSPVAAFSSPSTISNAGTSPLYQPFSLWPLKSGEEASLLRHYVQHLAAWVCFRPYCLCFVRVILSRSMSAIRDYILGLKYLNGLCIILYCSMLSLHLLRFTGIRCKAFRIQLLKNTTANACNC